MRFETLIVVIVSLLLIKVALHGKPLVKPTAFAAKRTAHMKYYSDKRERMFGNRQTQATTVKGTATEFALLEGYERIGPVSWGPLHQARAVVETYSPSYGVR
ncbi:MAG: hypothetical protein ACPGU7_02265 [Gammaproteobacteria bacterium]